MSKASVTCFQEAPGDAGCAPEIDGFSLPSDVAKGNPNCGVVAVAVAARCTFKEAWDLMASIEGRGSRWKGRSFSRTRIAALRKLGVPFQEVPLERGMMLATWVENHAAPGRRYMVDTTRHVQIVKDGRVLDQKGRRTASKDNPMDRRIVKSVLLLK